MRPSRRTAARRRAVVRPRCRQRWPTCRRRRRPRCRTRARPPRRRASIATADPSQRGNQMTCQPTSSRDRTGQCRLGSLAGFFLMQPQGERDGERGGHHAHHGERHREEGLLQGAGAAHPRDDVARQGAVAQLVADAVHHAAHHQAIQAQAHGPQQQRAAIQPPGQPEDVAQPRRGGDRDRRARRRVRRRRRGRRAADTPPR